MSIAGAALAADSAWRMDPARAASPELLERAEWVRDYGRFVWVVGDRAELAPLLAASTERIDSPYRIGLHGERFDPTELDRDEPSRAPDGAGLLLVQLRGPALADDLLALRDAGLDVFQPLPGFGYLAWGDAVSAGRAAGSPFLRHVGPLPTRLKTQPGLKARGEWIRNINVHFYNSGDPGDVARSIAALGARVIDVWAAQPDRRLYNAVIEADVRMLPALADLSEVIALSYLSPEPELEDESGAQVLADNLDANNIPFPGYPAWLGSVGLDGSGVTWSTTDSGVWYGHGDYSSRIVGGANYPGCNLANPGDDPTSGGHGTHVTGIFAGDGTAGFVDSDGFLYGHGVAPEVSIFAQNPICGSQSSWPPAGGWPVLSRDALTGGAIGSNNSWTSGEGTQHGYQATERTYDLMVLDGNFDTPSVLDPFMVVFSAGNSGGSGVTAPKEAKNVVVTGSLETFRVSGDVDAISGFSSRGPAVDGRWLPTISTPGESVSSTRRPSASSCASPISGTDGEYSFCSGTSMAAPHASGALILFTQWWRQQFAGATPSPAMGKALLINSATALSGSPPPNNDSGWGRVDLSTIVDDGLSFEFWDQETLFTASGESFTRTVGVVDPTQPLKVTLVWSDAPGAIGANPALVNDLDLTVTNGGTTYLGNNYSSGVSQPGGSPDRLNNIEQVTLPAPGPSATITVDAFQIAGSVLLDQSSVTTAQHFALICQNCLEEPDYTLELDPAEILACVPDSRDVTVQVGSLLGYSDPVSLATSGLPAGASGTFSVDPVDPGSSSTLSLTLGASVVPGTYAAQVEGNSTSGPKSAPLDLQLFDAAPAAPTLQAPVDGALDLPTDVAFSWAASAQGLDYRLEVATDAGFTDVIHDIVTRELQATLPLETATEYYWRVTALNACGQDVSVVFDLRTAAEPGVCAFGQAADIHWIDDMENGTNGWTTAALAGTDTWALEDSDATSPVHSWRGLDIATISDQVLVSPPIELPSGVSPLTLQYYGKRDMEDGGSACFDGGLLEYSNDGGATWLPVDSSRLLTNPYTGPIDDGFSNPLANRDAWCGTQDWTRTVVDLGGLEGQTVSFRYRIGTDSSVAADDWHIDDVRIQSCRVVQEEIFFDGFESP
ncbi:S8 family serine peptidase [Wenzhouxiangella sp. XN79A]|uniref:S8 family serine peptidase n=1 Tax=Wenzhouxiangella sp. XN79A TaxID=2724193 RepID=UPI00144A928F|nr:S8 family serine peptidase [Wenzhouxiangella sp. XN79A]NKI33713.1 S8 family serine peptidase [Wenzhouxiangella sp. XN79A]